MKQATVSEVNHPRYTHRVRYTGPGGKVCQSWFKNETDALACAKEKDEETGIQGKAFGVLGRDEKAVIEFWRAFVDRNPDTQPPPMMDVLKEFADRWTKTRSNVTVEHAVESYEEAKAAEGLRPKSLLAIKSRCGRFVEDFGARPLASVTTAEISDWLLGLRSSGKRGRGSRKKTAPVGLSLEAKRNHRIAIHGLFNFAKGRGWVDSNPVSDAAKPKPRRKQPGILHPEDVVRFLGAVETVAPEMLPFWVVRFFAGIREQEAVRMDWRMVDLKAKEIHLPSEITKTYQPRTLKMEPALVAFIKPYAQKTGPLCNLTEMARRIRLKKIAARLKEEDDEAGKDARPFPAPMPANAARHSFATFHLFAFRKPGETAMQLGHGGNPEMLHSNYKGVASEAEAKAFWAIRPSKAKNVVTFTKKKGRKSA